MFAGRNRSPQWNLKFGSDGSAIGYFKYCKRKDARLFWWLIAEKVYMKYNIKIYYQFINKRANKDCCMIINFDKKDDVLKFKLIAKTLFDE